MQHSVANVGSGSGCLLLICFVWVFWCCGLCLFGLLWLVTGEDLALFNRLGWGSWIFHSKSNEECLLRLATCLIQFNSSALMDYWKSPRDTGIGWLLLPFPGGSISIIARVFSRMCVGQFWNRTALCGAMTHDSMKSSTSAALGPLFKSM